MSHDSATASSIYANAEVPPNLQNIWNCTLPSSFGETTATITIHPQLAACNPDYDRKLRYSPTYQHFADRSASKMRLMHLHSAHHRRHSKQQQHLQKQFDQWAGKDNQTSNCEILLEASKNGNRSSKDNKAFAKSSRRRPSAHETTGDGAHALTREIAAGVETPTVNNQLVSDNCSIDLSDPLVAATEFSTCGEIQNSN